ncbi:MAG TPA: Z1 domain-containing protein, partial [Rhabdochlamydiaceae bacterium]|nr:Z1 domain-containing protein [Rhabdochlamydiaceae bacterium]
REIPPSSIYIQVTATPQALLLQTLKSGWKPEKVHVFEPGLGYCGGSHFYGENSKCIRPVPEYEKVTLLEGSEIPSGLQEALMSFLINSIYILDFCKKDVCNFLIHPGPKIDHHNTAESKILRLMKAIQGDVSIGSELLRSTLFQAYEDIKNTCPDMPAFDYFWTNLKATVERTQTQVLNSNTISEINYEKGSNILIGGNATGRGITFPGLQVAYYCRESKIPQADTLWQHSRIFGYDRNPNSCRIFLPPRLLQIFRRLNEANDSMFKMLVEHGLDQVTILEPEGVKPTRKNVIDQEALIPIIGDSNSYFEGVTHKNTALIDSMLGLQDREEELSIDKTMEILEMIDSDEEADGEDLDLYIRCLKTLRSAGEKFCYLIVRTDRDLAKGTGSLLSPNDRAKGASITDKTVLTLYRVNGQQEKGWNGLPLWVPNLKFPKGRCFYTVS